MKPQRSLTLQTRTFALLAVAVILGSTLGACAPVKYSDSEVSLDIHLKENAILSASSYLVAEMPDTDVYPQTTPRAFAPDQLCFVMNVSGSGIPQHFAQGGMTCESRFSGLGLLSPVFAWGQKPTMKIGYGDRRFDLVAFPKHIFGASCPKVIAATVEGGVEVFRVDGKVMAFPTGTDGPIQIASGETYVQPGANTIDLSVDKGDAGRVVGKNYGCRAFDVAPAPTVDNVFNTGLREAFFDVSCPTDADSIRVETDGGYASGTILCDPKSGEAFVGHITLDPFDLEASEWGWYDPQIKITAWQGNYKVSGLTYNLHYSSNMNYPSVKNRNATAELSWAAPDHKVYKIARIENGELVVHEKDTSNNHLREFSAGLSWTENSDKQLAGEWDGHAVQVAPLAESEMFDPTLLTGSMVGWNDAASHSVQVKRCPVGEEFCPSDWQGVAKTLTDSAGSAFDLFSYLGNATLWTLDLSAPLPRSQRFNLASETWSNTAFASVSGAAVGGTTFAPAWQNAQMNFVRAQRYSLGKPDLLLSHDLNLIAGGSSLSADDFGQRRSVIYRSFDGGKSWYQVYQGEQGTELLDAISTPATETTGGFVILEKYATSSGNFGIRVITQDAKSTGF